MSGLEIGLALPGVIDLCLKYVASVPLIAPG